jgi:hypothetical protein
MEARLRVFVDYEQEVRHMPLFLYLGLTLPLQKVPAQLVAYDGLVSIVEPTVSLFDWRV